MALRIAAGKPAPPPIEEEPVSPAGDIPQDTPAEPEATEPPAGDADIDDTGEGLLDPTLVAYKGPEQGPFTCSNCEYYSPDKPNTCLFVSGFIDDNALCNLFSPMKKESKEPEAAPEEAPLPTEAAPTAAPPIPLEGK